MLTTVGEYRERQIHHSSCSGYCSPEEELDEVTVCKAEGMPDVGIHLPLEQSHYTGLGRDCFPSIKQQSDEAIQTPSQSTNIKC